MLQAESKRTPHALLSHWRAVAPTLATIVAVCFMLLTTVNTQFQFHSAVAQSTSSPASELVLLPYSDRSTSARLEFDGNSGDNDRNEFSPLIHTLLGAIDDSLPPHVKPAANSPLALTNYFPSSNTPRAPPLFS